MSFFAVNNVIDRSRWWRLSRKELTAKWNTGRRQPVTIPASAAWSSWRRISNAPSTNPGLCLSSLFFLPLVGPLLAREGEAERERRPTLAPSDAVQMFGVGFRGVGACYVFGSQGIWLLTEECCCSSGHASAPPPLSELCSFFSPCRPYFELKAKYYLQLEVRMQQVLELLL